MPSFILENEYGRGRGCLVAGTDEAGRGPLAGPVMAAAVIIPQDFPDNIAAEINDSKKLSATKREKLFTAITTHCPHAIAEASAEEIDKINILHASMLAMQRAVETLQDNHSIKIETVLVDGNRKPLLKRMAVMPIVKGDSKSLSIAAASILAKVTRDRLMHTLHTAFPHYGWAQNMGYPTPDHLAALAAHGPCAHHRQSFAPVRHAIKKANV